MPPLKVIHLITRFDWGGSAQNTLLTALGHDPSRFQPLVIAGPTGPWNTQGGKQATEENQQRLHDGGIPLHLIPTFTREVNPLRDFQTLLSLIKIFHREQPTIVHTHTSKAGVLGRLAAWSTRVPVVIHTPHGHVFYGHFGTLKSWIFLLIEYILALGTSWMIALTETERDEHVERGVGNPHRFAVIPSGIDIRQFQRSPDSPKNYPSGFTCSPNAIVIGSVGWLTEVKGHRILIQALGKLKAHFPQIHGVIIGGGPLKQEFLQLASDLGLADSLQFFERRQDIPACLGAMDIYVQPSLNEGMGRALVEAMAAGLPIVASRVGGIPAIVEEGETGLLVPAGDVDALSSALTRFLTHREWARSIGHTAAHRLSTRFESTSMVRSIEGVYTDALNELGLSQMVPDQSQFM